MEFNQLKEFLEEKVIEFNQPGFIQDDPISIPHYFDSKEDIEIAAFLVATFAWGKREMIIRSAKDLMNRIGDSPYEFVLNYDRNSEKYLNGFYYRTFQELDIKYFFKSLSNIYHNHNGLESVFKVKEEETTVWESLNRARGMFFELDHLNRTEKHFSNPNKNASCKRLNMFLRWMCRKDNQGVDFGIWESISPQVLSCPLDVHTGNVSRELGLLSRKQDDKKAVIELDEALRKLDPNDPVKYDLALFGIGVSGQLNG